MLHMFVLPFVFQMTIIILCLMMRLNLFCYTYVRLLEKSFFFFRNYSESFRSVFGLHRVRSFKMVLILNSVDRRRLVVSRLDHIWMSCFAYRTKKKIVKITCFFLIQCTIYIQISFHFFQHRNHLRILCVCMSIFHCYQWQCNARISYLFFQTTLLLSRKNVVTADVLE